MFVPGNALECILVNCLGVLVEHLLYIAKFAPLAIVVLEEAVPLWIIFESRSWKLFQHQVQEVFVPFEQLDSLGLSEHLLVPGHSAPHDEIFAFFGVDVDPTAFGVFRFDVALLRRVLTVT